MFNRIFGRRDAFNEDQYYNDENKQLKLSIMQLQEQLGQTHQLYTTYQSEARKNLSEMQRVAQTICDQDYSKEQLGGQNRVLMLPAFELANFIIHNINKQKQESIQLIMDLQSALKKKEGQVEDLEAQLERLLQSQGQTQNKSSDTLGASPITRNSQGIPYDPQTGEILDEKDLKTANEPVTVNSDTSTTTKTHLVLLEEIERQLTEVQVEILREIGEKGLSEPKIIEEHLMAIPDLSINHTQFQNALNGLKSSLIIGEDKVVTGWRWFFALHLTDLGLQLFQRRFNKPAVLCEKHVLKRDHATWDHGYVIKDTATLMDMMGYTEISYERKQNEIELSNGRKWIPDVIAYDPIAMKKTYVEVELGNHTQEEFNEKMDKARQVTDEIRFVTNDKQTMDKIIQQQSRWKLEKMQAGSPVKRFSVWVTTTKKLSEKDWGNHYPS